MTSYGFSELGWLRWHWPCYLITYRAGRYTAERLDDHAVVRADSADELLDLIREDYTARPISRDVAP